MSIEMDPIGVVRTDAEKLPRTWRASDVEGAQIVDEAYTERLGDIEPGQRIVVIFNFHESPAFSPNLLRQTPPHRLSLPVASTAGPPWGSCLPVQNAYTKGIRAAAAKEARIEFLSRWSGQAAGLGRAVLAAEVLEGTAR